jgi:hypothetical protein
MKVLSQTGSRLVLAGIPGRRVWMIVCCGLGLFLTVTVGYIANLLYKDRGGLSLPQLPLAIGLLIGQGLFWTGVVTLAVGRRTLILDTTLGTGEYRVRSPFVEAGKPCRFQLDQIDSIVIETSKEIRPGLPGHADDDATVHRLRLRLTQPRRAITIDETENNRLARLESLAEHVAGFLGRTPERVNCDAN